MSCPYCGCKETYQYDDSEEAFLAGEDTLERCAACGGIFDIEDHAEEEEDHDDEIIRAAVAAMRATNPLVAEDLLTGFTMHTEKDDIIAIWKASRVQALEEAAKVCDDLRNKIVGAQSGHPDELANLMLRQIGELGAGECATALRSLSSGKRGE